MHARNNGRRVTTQNGNSGKEETSAAALERGEKGDVISRLVCRGSKAATVNGVGVLTRLTRRPSPSFVPQILQLTGH